jgi:threonine dehydrogenase-like Zn-dependent dehydrogenase
MKAVYFDVSIPKILITKSLSKIFPSICYSSLSPVGFGEFEDQRLPGKGWVRVENILSGICGTDVSMFFVKAHPSISIAALPGVPRVFLGHEIIGRVVETGEGVTELSAGDRVTMQSYLPCCFMKEIEPPCDSCRNGNYNTCENFSVGELPVNLGAGFADRFIAHQSQLVKVPDEISDEDAVLIEPAAVSLHAVLKRPPKDDENILVIGAGTIGLNVIQFSKIISPGCRIFLMEKIDFKKDFALRLGADQLLEGDPYSEVAGATGGKLYRGPLGNSNILGGFDLIYDCVGHSRTIHDSLRWLKARGDYVMIGNQLTPVSFDQTPIWHQELRIIGVNSHGAEEFNGRKTSSFELVMEMIQSGKVKLDHFITHRFPLNEYRKVFRFLRNASDQIVKVVFEMK